eukprot:7391705-Prymnesium_polylepis.1
MRSDATCNAMRRGWRSTKMMAKLIQGRFSAKGPAASSSPTLPPVASHPYSPSRYDPIAPLSTCEKSCHTPSPSTLSTPWLHISAHLRVLTSTGWLQRGEVVRRTS